MAEPYQDPKRSVPERAKDLLARMTVDEKIAQMHALWLILSEDGRHRPRQDDFTGGTDPEVVKKSLGHGLGQISRPLGSHGVDARQGVRALNRLQKFLREETRLGIPAMSHEECLVGLMARGATMFPSALAYSATWNPDLIERAARAIGGEVRSVGCHQGLAPVLDVSRDVRWGRTEETLGEDPYLVGVLGTRFVRGLQGEKRDLLATLKHYAGHSFSEGARNHGPVHLGWRELNDTFLLPFEMAVKQAHAGSVMPAYHDIDNESCHASRHLLTEVLREEWGFDGLIVADYIGISLLYQHHNLAKDPAAAAAMAFAAGLATGGFRPVVAIYSTFLQRGYDSIIHDVAIQKLPVIFCLDRAGMVGADGQTHMGLYDLAYLSAVPHMTVTQPKDGAELIGLLRCALAHTGGPFAIRYPRDSVPTAVPAATAVSAVPYGTWELLRPGRECAILAVGVMSYPALEAAARFEGRVEVLDLRTISPWDQEGVLASVRKTGRCLVVHEDTWTAGFAGEILATLAEQAFLDLDAPLRRLATPDVPTPYSATLMKAVLPNAERIAAVIEDMLAF